MKNQCERMYVGLVTSIQSRTADSPSYRQWIEECFHLCIEAYSRLHEIKESHPFTGRAEEICFYKTIEPHFAALIKYFTLLYAAEMFVPEDPVKRVDYWNNELKKSLGFFEKHEAFYRYYKKGLTRHDSRYFFASSSYVDLLASFIAREKYLAALRTKIIGQSGRQP